MSVLHLVNTSPFETAALIRCLERAGEGDAVLLLESGVYGALSGCGFSAKVAAVAGSLDILVLEPDLEARGLDRDRLLQSLRLADYSGFVELAVQHPLSLSWT